MGAFVFEQFTDLVGSATRLIGEWPTVTGDITWIATDAEQGDELVFLKQIPATMLISQKSVPYRRKTSGGVSGQLAQWIRLELQVSVDKHPPIQHGSQMVLARKPGAFWVTAASFKRSNQKGENERINPLAEPFADEEELIRHIEALDYDYWEKNGRYLTAGISRPEKPMEDDRPNSSRTSFYIGACENFEKCISTLSSHSKLQKLIEMTDSRTIKFWPKKILTIATKN